MGVQPQLDVNQTRLEELKAMTAMHVKTAHLDKIQISFKLIVLLLLL